MKLPVLVLTFVAALARTAAADPQTADRLVSEANALAKNGDFVGAAAKFKAASSADPRPELVCNVGVAYYKARELPRSQLYLSRCLERGSAFDAKFVASVRTALEAVEKALRSGEFAPVDIVVEPAGATIVIRAFGEDEAFIGSRLVWLPAGPQVLTARAEGYADKRIEVAFARAAAPLTVKVTLDRAPIVDTTRPPTSTGPASTGVQTDGPKNPDVPTQAPPPPSVETRSKVPPLVATGLTLAAVAMFAVYYVDAHDQADRAGFALTREAYDADVSGIDRSNTLMAVGGIASVVGVGISSYLWYRAFQTPARVGVEANATGGAITFSSPW